ncbi:uncharacterized protein LOC129725033 isoform X2 [Wyeomyia smithii]|uniref:uncharacterized protein LOC129725033 isoform X2 n=1 Tax=Wyeomyia smithii TaxID=174621 RepID=UPI0024681739|nr:uncharacterized protein LOC129725033 isoform X2 [Wyeomyia smithii]XP_055536389.1 uncharacterized protein LOC129725033 isoform X2 [Wyeomyia smithii]
MHTDELDMDPGRAGPDGNSMKSTAGSNVSSHGNVRSRVRYWLNDIVDEMRKKSPASVQKWVDSIQIPSSTNASSDTDPGPSSSQLAAEVQLGVDRSDPGEITGSSLELENNELVVGVGGSTTTSYDDYAAVETSVSNDGKSRSIKNLLSMKLEKLNRSNVNLEQENSATLEQESSAVEAEPRKSTSLASIGKIKINEFYDKLSMNKAKYNLIKSKKLDIRNMLGASKENLTHPLQSQRQAEDFQSEAKADTEEGMEPLHIVESLEEHKLHDSEASGKVSTGDIYEFSFDESFPKDEDILDASEDEEKENVKMPPDCYENFLIPPKSYHRMGIGRIGRSSSENPHTNKRFNLMEIGRSFSEMNDDDQFDISESNNSCPNPSSLNTSSSINNSNNNILTRSVPVSPIPHASSKLSIHQENSLSESPRRRSAMLIKDSSLQSDSSRCSSVESLLNARKPDPERILLNLGFGPAPHSGDVLSKIPKRFLKPSQVRGVDTEAFLRQQQLSMHIHENSVLGYRGLVGNPHIPPSMIVAKIMERFQENERGRLVRSSTCANASVGMSTSAPTGRMPESHNSSGPPSPIPIQRHSSLASDERIQF